MNLSEVKQGQMMAMFGQAMKPRCGQARQDEINVWSSELNGNSREKSIKYLIN